MNKANLIRLGSLCQKKFEMKDDFDVVEFPSDSSNRVRVAIRMSLSTAPSPYYPFPSEYDEIDFSEKIGSYSKAEQVWVGYGKKSNTLIIKETL